MDHVAERRQEILDGRRSWTAGDDAGGDYDIFFTQIVRPLRVLRNAGMFDELDGHFDEGRRIFAVEIGGAINLDFPKKEE